MTLCLASSNSKAESPPTVAADLESQVRALQRQLDALEADLARSERLATLGAMSGAIAHEFNNILTPLLNYAAMALAHPEDEQLTRKALEKTLQGAERASQVADALLGSLHEAAAPEYGCNLRNAVETALTSLIRPPIADGIEVLIDIPCDLKVAISPIDLHQVLLNLVLNACEAMRPGPGTLAFSAAMMPEFSLQDKRSHHTNRHRTTETPSRIILRIVDTGPGMPAELAERVFDPLVTTKQRSPGANKQGGGSGLGLTICKRLIQRAGGTITLRSEPGIGTSFAIQLPCFLDAAHGASGNDLAA